MQRILSLVRNRFMRWSILIVLLSVLSILWCDHRVVSGSAPYVFDTVEHVPHNRVGLVLGTSEKSMSGSPNLYFAHRIAAAVELYRAGKVDRLLVSGDNGTTDYNEPVAMRNALITAGVDSAHITLDHAGFRTLDSMVRAREVFGVEQVTIISQRFHNERAVHIARHLGMEAVGYNARDVGAYSGFRTRVREKAARVKVFLDLAFGKGPRFLGDPVTIE